MENVITTMGNEIALSIKWGMNLPAESTARSL